MYGSSKFLFERSKIVSSRSPKVKGAFAMSDFQLRLCSSDIPLGMNNVYPGVRDQFYFISLIQSILL